MNEMKTCPTCGANTTVLTVMAHYVLTSEDVAWLQACGIDPEMDSIEDSV